MSAVALVLAAAVAVPPSPPTHRVEDHAGLMSGPARAVLDARLTDYEQATGHQVVVWIDHTLGGAALDDWSARTFAAWQLGRQGHDDGVAMFVFADDRKIAIEVGYGLEDRIPDAVAARIIREVMAPRLASQQADAGIRDGADAILAAIEGQPWRGSAIRPPVDVPSTVALVLGGLAGVALLLLLITHPRLVFLLWLLDGRGRGGGFGGGGGFRGGGGRSGGGGARGGW